MRTDVNLSQNTPHTKNMSSVSQSKYQIYEFPSVYRMQTLYGNLLKKAQLILCLRLKSRGFQLLTVYKIGQFSQLA